MMRRGLLFASILSGLVLTAALIAVGGCNQDKSTGGGEATAQKAGPGVAGAAAHKPSGAPELDLRAVLSDSTGSTEPEKLVRRFAIGDAMIVVTYHTSGNVENCGCSPIQLGGLAARGAMIDAVREIGPALTIDIGAITDGKESFNLLKASFVLKAMELAGYDGMGLGVSELKVAPEELSVLLDGVETPFYIGNAYVESESWDASTGMQKRYEGRELLPLLEPDDLPSMTEEKGKTYAPLAPPGFVWRPDRRRTGRRVGVVFLNFTALSETDLELPGYVLVDPREWLDAWSANDNWKLADIWVLAAEGYSAKIAQVMKDYSHFNLILTGDFHPSGRDEEEMLQPVETESGATWLNTFNFGGYLGLVNLEFPLSKDGELLLAAYNLPIISTFSPDTEIQEMVQHEYREALASVFREQSFAHRAAVIIEPKECSECHQEEYEVFKGSDHPNSLETLRNKEQEHNVECLSCHIVYDYTEDKMYPLQCVSCHPDITYRHIAEARAGLELSEKDDASFTYEFCARCHTPRQSTRFRGHFNEYAAKVRH